MKTMKVSFLLLILLILSGCALLHPTPMQPTLEQIYLPDDGNDADDIEKGILYWQKKLYGSATPEKYVDEPVEILGFIYRRADDPKEVFFIGRELLACCYSDTFPQGLPVFLTDNKQYKNKQWYTVQGHWEQITNDEGKRMVIIPDKIMPATPPEDPYIYMTAKTQ